ncbi:MAG: AAA family ATPase [Proteobacteria bacterium]|nr:AAA family ATPase [Pseudomonadota bacterium]
MSLSDSELNIIKEEENNLRRLQKSFADQIKDTLRDDILNEITELNELIPDVNSDDLPQVKAQLIRLDAVLSQIDSAGTTKLDILNPYFGHMKLADQHGFKDLYLGTQVYRSVDGSIQIIDWKTSPIGRIYFLYEEGDEHEEDIEGRIFEGEVLFKRILRIVDGNIVEIQTGDQILKSSADGSWVQSDTQRYLLKGGAGSAPRPQNTASIKSKMGIGSESGIRGSKFLPEITALIDPSQFDLITQPETGVVAIQGLAGSGKTTIALHRVAWLHFQDRQRFSAEKILVMVFNRALSNYISKVLPSLGVSGIIIENFENWVSKLRIRLFSGHLPRSYSEHTPVTVIRFKKHPVLFQLINDFIEAKEREFEVGISDLVDQQKFRPVLQDLEGIPLISRLYNFYEWLEGKRQLGNCKPEFDAVTKTNLLRVVTDLIDPEKDRMSMLLEFWEDLFTDYHFLQFGFNEGSDDFTTTQIAEVIDWLRHQFAEINTKDPAPQKDLVEIVSNEEDSSAPRTSLDYEDDPILLYMYQRLLKEIAKKNKKPLQYNHIMVDEVQDFSPIELAVLTNIAKQPLSLTFAGDVNQKMIKESGFINWETTFQNLGIKGQKVSTLKVGYRSTYEIMDFSFRVLGNLSQNREFMATRHGPPVEAFKFSNQGELIQYLSRSLIDTMINEPMASIAVICISPEEAKAYFELLNNVEIADLRLIDDQNFPFTPGIDVTDVRQVKGLEFDYVVLLDVDMENYRNDNYSRYLLHIAASRAAHQLWIVNHRNPSLILPEEFRDESGRIDSLESL